jgi:hypothetical protein
MCGLRGAPPSHVRPPRRTAFEPIEAPPGAHQGLLNGVLGLERRAEHPVAVGGQLRSVLLEPQLDGGVEVGRAGHARPLLPSHRRVDNRTEGTARAVCLRSNVMYQL